MRNQTNSGKNIVLTYSSWCSTNEMKAYCVMHQSPHGRRTRVLGEEARQAAHAMTMLIGRGVAREWQGGQMIFVPRLA